MVHFDLARAAFDAGEGVGDGHAEVVVAVRGEDDVFGVRDTAANGFEERAVFRGRGVADGVGEVDGLAPAWMATVTIWTRKSRSERVASSAENSTSST